MNSRIHPLIAFAIAVAASLPVISSAEGPFGELIRPLEGFKSQQQDVRKKAVEDLKAALQQPEVARVFQDTMKLKPKSDKDVQLRNIALMVNEAVAEDPQTKWRKILRDEKIVTVQAIKDSATLIWAMVQFGQLKGSLFDDFNTPISRKIDLRIGDIIEMYGEPDAVIPGGDTDWHMYGPVGVGTKKGSDEVEGRLRIPGFLWLALEKSFNGKYPDVMPNPGVPDIAIQLKE